MNVIDLFCDLGDCDLGAWVTLGWLTYMALCANLVFIWVIAMEALKGHVKFLKKDFVSPN